LGANGEAASGGDADRDEHRVIRPEGVFADQEIRKDDLFARLRPNRDVDRVAGEGAVEPRRDHDPGVVERRGRGHFGVAPLGVGVARRDEGAPARGRVDPDGLGGGPDVLVAHVRHGYFRSLTIVGADE
jgi:hypothetical protein